MAVRILKKLADHQQNGASDIGQRTQQPKPVRTHVNRWTTFRRRVSQRYGSLRPQRDNRKGQSLSVVCFTTTGKETVTTELRWGRMRGSSVGDRFEIRYLPERPKVINFRDGGFPYFSALWSVIGSIVFVTIGVRLLS
jgi:hypothetical protein